MNILWNREETSTKKNTDSQVSNVAVFVEWRATQIGALLNLTMLTFQELSQRVWGIILVLSRISCRINS